MIKDTREETANAAGMAIDILKGNEPETQESFFTGNTMLEVPTRICSSSICTVDNIRDLLIDSGYYTEEEIYGPKR